MAQVSYVEHHSLFRHSDKQVYDIYLHIANCAFRRATVWVLYSLCSAALLLGIQSRGAVITLRTMHELWLVC